LPVDCRFDRRRAPWQDDPVRRFVLLSLLGIAILLGGSLAVILWMTEGGAGLPAPEPAPAAAPVQPQQRPPVILAPPPVTASAIENFEKPVPKSVPEPPSPPPPVDLAPGAPALESVVSRRCGSMQVRLGDEMRKGGEQITGQAILLFDVVPEKGRVKFGQSRQQSPGNMRPSLVACAQMALKGQVVAAPGAKDGKPFTVQVVLGMKE
jgi:hypothetical protein